MTFTEQMTHSSFATIYCGLYGHFPAIVTPLEGTKYGIHTCLDRNYTDINNRLVRHSSLVLFKDDSENTVWFFVGGPKEEGKCPEELDATEEVVEDFRRAFVAVGGDDRHFAPDTLVGLNTGITYWRQYPSDR
jgi:hypothetical protein